MVNILVSSLQSPAARPCHLHGKWLLANSNCPTSHSLTHLPIPTSTVRLTLPRKTKSKLCFNHHCPSQIARNRPCPCSLKSVHDSFIVTSLFVWYCFDRLYEIQKTLSMYNLSLVWLENHDWQWRTVTVGTYRHLPSLFWIRYQTAGCGLKPSAQETDS